MGGLSWPLRARRMAGDGGPVVPLLLAADRGGGSTLGFEPLARPGPACGLYVNL